MILLADVEELSYKEIADIVGAPVGTVMSRLHRARKQMQVALSEYAVALGIAPAQVQAPVALDAYRKKRNAGS